MPFGTDPEYPRAIFSVVRPLTSCDADRQVRVLEAKWQGSAMSSVETAELVKAVMKKPFPLPNSRDAGVEIISLEQLFGHAT